EAGQPSLKQQVQTELAKQGTEVGEVKGRDAYVKVDANGHKHDTTADDPDKLAPWRAIVTGITSGVGMGYEMYKHRRAPETPSTADASTTHQGSYGDRQVDTLIQKIKGPDQNFDPLTAAADSFRGRGRALENVAHGQVPGWEAIKTGADITLTMAEFAGTGNVRDLSKGKLAQAAAQDAINNFGVTVEGIKEVAKAGATAATVTDGKINDLQGALADATGRAVDTAVVGVSTGLGVATVLDGAAAIAPHPVAKAGLKGASMLWKIAGAVHLGEQISDISEKRNEIISNELGKEAMEQIRQSNEVKRGQITDALKRDGWMK
ncbi:hypothetical protein, partial [Burkholderia ubonensis]